MLKPLLYATFIMASLTLEGKSPEGVHMTSAGPSFDGQIISSSEEMKKGELLLRTKNLKAGGHSFLIKNTGSSLKISIFGRPVTIEKDGQYLVKWNNSSEKVETAMSDCTSTEWTPPEEVSNWFKPGSSVSLDLTHSTSSTPPPAPLPTPSPTPSQTPSPTATPLPTPPPKVVLAPSSKMATENAEVLSKKQDPLPTHAPDRTTPRRIEFKPEALSAPLFSPIKKIDTFPSREPVPPSKYGADAAVVPLDTSSENEYVIQPGDIIDLEFYRTQRVTVDMKGDVRVSASIGTAESSIHAAGKTPREISTAVSSSGLNFRSILDPALKVNVAKFADRTIVVLGLVKEPGKIPLEDGEVIGIPAALKKAGGISCPSTKAVVYIKRGDKITKAKLSQSDEASLNLFRITPGDIITVSQIK